MLFGRIEVDGFFKVEGGRLVGYGRRREFDAAGRMIRESIEPTGVTIVQTFDAVVLIDPQGVTCR